MIIYIRLIDQMSGITEICEIFVNDIYGKFNYKDKIIIDIGGFIGDSSLYFISKGAKKVYVYEINTDVYEILEENIKRNHLNNKIIAFNNGISNEFRNEILYITKIKASASIYSNISTQKGIIEERHIEVVPFNDILKEPIDILKIDCEGCEYKILEDILKQNLFEKIQEGIILEAHCINEKWTPNYARFLLKKIGYKKINSFNIKDQHLEMIYCKK